MPENITPEEKLLKLIENPATVKPPRNSARKLHFSFQAIKSRFKAIRNIKIGISSQKIERLFNLRSINQLLILASSLFSVYLIFDFIKAKPDLDMLNFGQRIKQAKSATALVSNNFTLNDYLSQIKTRDIFHFIPLKKQEPDNAKETLASLMNNLRLVGIIWSSKPQVMIEDKQENKTWILNQDDEILKVNGKIKIKQIFKDRAILSFEGQEMELM